MEERTTVKTRVNEPSAIASLGYNIAFIGIVVLVCYIVQSVIGTHNGVVDESDEELNRRRSCTAIRNVAMGFTTLAILHVFVHMSRVVSFDVVTRTASGGEVLKKRTSLTQ